MVSDEEIKENHKRFIAWKKKSNYELSAEEQSILEAPNLDEFIIERHYTWHKNYKKEKASAERIIEKFNEFVGSFNEKHEGLADIKFNGSIKGRGRVTLYFCITSYIKAKEECEAEETAARLLKTRPGLYCREDEHVKRMVSLIAFRK